MTAITGITSNKWDLGHWFSSTRPCCMVSTRPQMMKHTTTNQNSKLLNNISWSQCDKLATISYYEWHCLQEGKRALTPSGEATTLKITSLLLCCSHLCFNTLFFYSDCLFWHKIIFGYVLQNRICLKPHLHFEVSSWLK